MTSKILGRVGGSLKINGPGGLTSGRRDVVDTEREEKQTQHQEAYMGEINLH